MSKTPETPRAPVIFGRNASLSRRFVTEDLWREINSPPARVGSASVGLARTAGVLGPARHGHPIRRSSANGAGHRGGGLAGRPGARAGVANRGQAGLSGHGGDVSRSGNS